MIDHHMYEAYGERAWHEDFGDARRDDFPTVYPGRPRATFDGRSVESFAGRGPSSYKRPDHRIHEDVCERLTADPHVDAGDVEVSVEDGVVLLDGTVPDRDTRWRADEIVAGVWGVRDVHNRLRMQRR